VVSDLSDMPEGRRFTVSLAPRQRLPTHRNAAQLVIRAVSGHGEIAVGETAPRRLMAGTAVQVEPGVEHGLTAGDDGLVVEVTRLLPCCPDCS